MKPFTEYYEAFNENDKKITNTLSYDFTNKEDFIKHYKVAEALLIDSQY